MKTAYWDSGLRWDDPNLRWGVAILHPRTGRSRLRATLSAITINQ